MNILSSGPKSVSLQKKSTDILSIFTKAVEDLNKVNENAAKEAIKKEEEIALATLELESLDKLTTVNAKIVAKINAILN